MKTKQIFLYLFSVVAFLSFPGCSSQGPQGPAGVNGQNAAVYYSNWLSPTAWSGSAGDWYFSVSAPDLTQDVVEHGVVLAYVWLSGDVYNSTTVRPLPAYVLGANWSFLIHQYGSMEFTCDMSTQPFNSGDKFRFIAIPGTSTALKTVSVKYNTRTKLLNMPYSEACKVFDIKDSTIIVQ
ncbi:MAG: hypothetical protein PHR83_16845 [Paludibacter sp.]|nr:hypothetical protein [Paludibacter sp.]